MRVPVDQAAREAAMNDLDRSYLLEAGAGTGKTSVLVGRIVSIVRSGRARLSEVVAITFAEKAAGELKGRVREQLEEGLAGAAPGSPGAAPGSPEAERLQNALLEADQANITTIHSFAVSLLRERPVEAGVDPGFEVIDDLAESLLIGEVWERWFKDQLAAGPPALRRALRLGLQVRHLADFARELVRHRDVAGGVVTGTGADTGPGAGTGTGADTGTGPDFVARFRDGVTRLKDLAETSCVSRGDEGFIHIGELAINAQRLARLAPEDQERYILREIRIKKKGNQGNWRSAGACREQKALCGDLAEAHGTVTDLIRADVVSGLIAWLGGFLCCLREEKQRRGVLGFDDLLVEARNLLRDHPEVRAYFQSRFRYLLVDEFQDTDPLQAEIVFFLAEGEPRAARWDETLPAPGKLLIVADPKQSIYRFRRADIEIYEQAKGRLLAGGHVLAITQNFRTVPGIVAWVNEVFARLIQPAAAGCHQPCYVHLDAFRAPRPETGVVLLPPPAALDPEEMNAEALREAEAACVAALIRRVVDEGWAVHARDGTPRTACFRDIALLLPALTGIEIYEDALKREGVPYRLEGGKQFHFRDEVRSLAQVLAALDDPGDALAVVATLRSPLGGCSDDDLVLWRAAGGGFNYLQPLPPRRPGGGCRLPGRLAGTEGAGNNPAPAGDIGGGFPPPPGAGNRLSWPPRRSGRRQSGEGDGVCPRFRGAGRRFPAIRPLDAGPSGGGNRRGGVPRRGGGDGCRPDPQRSPVQGDRVSVGVPGEPGDGPPAARPGDRRQACRQGGGEGGELERGVPEYRVRGRRPG